MVRYSIAVLAGMLVLAAAGTPISAAPDDGAQKVASTGPAAVNEALTPQYHGDGVAAIVNDTVISDYDLRQRVALFVATSGIKPNEKQLKEIRSQVLEQLETERMQLLEAQKLNVTVSSGEVDKAIENIISENHLTMERLKAMFAQAGVYISTLRAQIAAQIAWSKTVQARYGDDVDVRPADVESELKRLAQSADKPRLRVSEVFMAVDSPEDADKVRKSMEELEVQLRAGAPFPAVARQFSQNPTAAQGGDLGWVSPGQLQPELDKAVLAMQPGQISPPIRAAGGFYVLALVARQEPEGTKLPEQTGPKYPPGMLPLARVLLPIGPTPPKDLLERATQAALVIRSNIQNCTMLPELVSKMKGAVYMNLGTMPLNQLSQDMQKAIAATAPGGTSPPLRSAAGVELIVRCDPAPPKITTFKMPTREEVEQKLFEEQITVFARRYMRDLRRDADIETR